MSSDVESDDGGFVEDDEESEALESQIEHIHTRVLLPGNTVPTKMILQVAYNNGQDKKCPCFAKVKDEKFRILKEIGVEECDQYVMKINNKHEGTVINMEDSEFIHIYAGDIATDSIVKIELIKNIVPLVNAH